MRRAGKTFVHADPASMSTLSPPVASSAGNVAWSGRAVGTRGVTRWRTEKTPPTDVSDFVLKYRYGTSATEIADDEVTVHVASDAPPGDPQQTTTCPQQADSLQQ